MRRDHFAEWMIGLFTTRERAAAIVGDLVDTAPTRSPQWFWSAVCRTAGSLLWRDFAADSVFLAGLGFRVLPLNILFLLTAVIAVSILTGLLSLAFGDAGMASWMIGLGVIKQLQWLLNGLAEFQTGRWIARRARGKEMAACAAFILIQFLVITLAEQAILNSAWATSVKLPANSALDNLNWVLMRFSGVAFLLTGAITARRDLTKNLSAS